MDNSIKNMCKGGKVEESKFYAYCGNYVGTMLITTSFTSVVHNLIAELPEMGSLLEVSSSLCDCNERRPPQPQESL